MLPTLIAAALVQQQAVPSQIIDRGRLEESRAPGEIVQQRPEGSVAVLSGGTTRPIQGIEFQGASAPAEVAAAAEQFIGRIATKGILTELAGALAKAYEKTNVAFYTIAIPDQTFEENVVVVLLAEGWIDSVRILSEGGEQFPLLRRQAGRMVGENPLRRSVYERQVSLMRAIPGLTFDASFDNPDDDESLTLQLTPRQDRSQLTASISNRGPDLVGDLLVEGRGELFRLLTDGDRFALTATGNPNLRNYRQLGASYALPIGSDGLTLTGNAMWLETRPPELDVEGSAKLGSLTALYPVLRTFRSAADLTFGVDAIDSSNAALGNIIVTEKTRAARLGGSFVSAGEAHNFSATGTLSQGLDILGASVGLTGAEPDFQKVNASATYNRNLGPTFVGRVSVTVSTRRTGFRPSSSSPSADRRSGGRSTRASSPATRASAASWRLRIFR